MLNDSEFLTANAHISDAEIAEDITECKKMIGQMTHARSMSLSIAPRLAMGYSAKVREAKELLYTVERLARLRQEKSNERNGSHA